MEFEIKNQRPVEITVMGVSSIILVLTQTELTAILIALKKRMKKCKAELFTIPQITVGEKPGIVMPKFNPYSFALMAEFWLEHTYVIWREDMLTNTTDAYPVDFRLIEQFAKALTGVFADSNSLHQDQVIAAQLLTEIYPILARFVYAEPVEEKKSNGITIERYPIVEDESLVDIAKRRREEKATPADWFDSTKNPKER